MRKWFLNFKAAILESHSQAAIWKPVKASGKGRYHKSKQKNLIFDFLHKKAVKNCEKHQRSHKKNYFYICKKFSWHYPFLRYPHIYIWWICQKLFTGFCGRDAPRFQGATIRSTVERRKTYYSISLPSLTAMFSYSSLEAATISARPRVASWLDATRLASVSPGSVTIGVPAHSTSIPTKWGKV